MRPLIRRDQMKPSDQETGRNIGHVTVVIVGICDMYSLCFPLPSPGGGESVPSLAADVAT